MTTVPQSESYILVDGRPISGYLVGVHPVSGGALLADEMNTDNLTEFRVFMPPSEISALFSDAREIEFLAT